MVPAAAAHLSHRVLGVEGDHTGWDRVRAAGGETQGTELRFVDALVRGLASVFSIGALGIGCFWMLQDAERQMWHDKIAGTLVVKVPRDMVLP